MAQESEHSLPGSFTKGFTRLQGDQGCSLIWGSTEEGSSFEITQVVGRIHSVPCGCRTDSFHSLVAVGQRSPSAFSCCPQFLATWGSPSWPLTSSKPARESEKIGTAVLCDIIISHICNHKHPSPLPYIFIENKPQFMPYSKGDYIRV